MLESFVIAALALALGMRAFCVLGFAALVLSFAQTRSTVTAAIEVMGPNVADNPARMSSPLLFVMIFVVLASRVPERLLLVVRTLREPSACARALWSLKWELALTALFIACLVSGVLRVHETFILSSASIVCLETLVHRDLDARHRLRRACIEATMLFGALMVLEVSALHLEAASMLLDVEDLASQWYFVAAQRALGAIMLVVMLRRMRAWRAQNLG